MINLNNNRTIGNDAIGHFGVRIGVQASSVLSGNRADRLSQTWGVRCEALCAQ